MKISRKISWSRPWYFCIFKRIFESLHNQSCSKRCQKNGEYTTLQLTHGTQSSHSSLNIFSWRTSRSRTRSANHLQKETTMTTTSTAPQTKPPNSLNLPRNATATHCPNTLPKWPLVMAMILHSPATQSSDYWMIMVSTSYKQGSAETVDEPKTHPTSSVPLIFPPPRATVASPYHHSHILPSSPPLHKIFVSWIANLLPREWVLQPTPFLSTKKSDLYGVVVVRKRIGAAYRDGCSGG